MYVFTMTVLLLIKKNAVATGIKLEIKTMTSTALYINYFK